MLVVIETHPIQYHAPVYRLLQGAFGIPVTVIYGSDFSTVAHRDPEFDATVSWDTDLLGGYSHRFLSRGTGQGTPHLSGVSLRELGKVLRDLSPKVTLLVGYSPSFHRRAWIAAWRYGAPILFRGETTDLVQSHRPLVAAARGVALRVAYRTCARLLYIGSRSYRHYEQLGVSPDRLVFAPYCVDTTPFRPSEQDRVDLRHDARHRLGITDDQYVIAFAGKLSQRKGVDLLAQAIRRLPPALRTRCVLVCAGDGALRDLIRETALAEPAVPLHLLGVQSQQALSAVYHMADVLVLPSRRAETWGLVVNEALHHGLPCVVSDRVGCAVDLVTDATGAVCRGDDELSLAEAIARVAGLSGRASVRDACRKQVATYSVERAAEGIARAYHSAVPMATR